MGNISIFGREIPLYGICFVLGIAISACVGVWLIKKKKIERFDLAASAVYTMIGAMVGAKLLFVLVSIEQIIKYNLSFLDVMRGGFVFYGGLIGGILGLFIYTKQFKLKFLDFLDIYATILPLGHSLGRVGCYFSGCCYGMEVSSGSFMSVVYEKPNNALTPVGVPLLAIQLIEAILLIFLFALMLILFLKVEKLNGKLAFVYAIAYAITRFILEYFRGDKERGGLLGISTSQWISILIALVSISIIITLVLIKRKKEQK